MISANLIAPVMALVLWSLIVLFWMIAIRLPAMKQTGIDFGTVPPGGRGQDLEKLLPPQKNWGAHNYAHLMEQPTVFYACVLGLALLGQGNAINVGLAWGYVAIRIIHSVWQIRVNRVAVRARLFVLSTLVLVVLAVRGMFAALEAAL